MVSNNIREVVDRAQELAGRIDASWRDRARAAVSRALSRFADSLPWTSLRSQEDFLTNGEPVLVLPERVGSLITVFDKTNSRPLLPHGHWNDRSPGVFSQETVGNPLEYEDTGWRSFTSQPVTDTALELSAGASEAFEVRISGFVRDTQASGTALELQQRYEVLVMGGTNWTATSNVWAELTGLEKEFGTGTWLRARNPLTNQVISFIPPGDSAAQHRAIRTLPVATAGITLRIQYFRRPPAIQSEDFPIDASVDLDYLVWSAAGDLHWQLKEAQAAQRAWLRADEILKARLQEQKRNPTHKATRPAFTYYSLESPLGKDF